MRRPDLHLRNRKDLVWYSLGFILVQLGLAVGIDQIWPAIRDPDYDDLERIVRDRQAEAPGRPLILALGSSRTQEALNAGLLNSSTDPGAPLVVNCAAAGAGPMTYEIFLRRMLRAGIRPQHVFIEIIPSGLSIRDGAPLEERRLNGERFTVSEVLHVSSSCAEPYRVLYPWARARMLPVQRHQAELRDALMIDNPVGGGPRYHAGRDNFGWIMLPGTCFTQEQVEERKRWNIASFASALTQPALAPGAVRMYRVVLTICQHEHISVTLVVPPESTTFRSYAPDVAQSQMEAVRSLANEFAVPLIDAIAWVDDDGFHDGHHAFAHGANQFTERFRREALAPLLTPRPSWTAASPPARDGH
jgi:hypothetical protein